MFFTYYLNLPLKNIFFQFRSTALRKLTANEKNKEIFSIEKLNDYFSEDFFEVLYIYVGLKTKILESHTNFCDFFSRNTRSFLKSSKFELEKS